MYAIICYGIYWDKLYVDVLIYFISGFGVFERNLKTLIMVHFFTYTHVQWKRTTYENDYIFLTT